MGAQTIKTYIVGTQKCLAEAIIITHNICFKGEMVKKYTRIIVKYSSLTNPLGNNVLLLHF